jgi:hypothetical protein
LPKNRCFLLRSLHFLRLLFDCYLSASVLVKWLILHLLLYHASALLSPPFCYFFYVYVYDIVKSFSEFSSHFNVVVNVFLKKVLTSNANSFQDVRWTSAH